MKKPSIIYILIIACIAFVFTNTYLVFNYISNTDKEIEQLNKISTSINLSNSLLSAIKDAEIGQRGFIITQDEIYLTPYLNAKSNLNKRKVDFYKSTLGLNYISVDTLRKINILIYKKIIDIDSTINLVKANKVAQALASIRTNEGKYLMDSLRAKLRNIRTLTEQHIIALQINLETKRKQLKYFIFVFNFLIISSLLAFILRLRNRDRKIVNLIKSVTQQKNEVNILANDLQEQNEKLLKYSHILSHDLRAPIQNFNGLINLYEVEEDENEKQMFFSMLKKQCDDLSIKIADLVDELKLIHYKKQERKSFDVRLLIEKVLVQFQQEIYATKTKISNHITENIILEGTGTFLESIIQNLISNAIKYRALDRDCMININAFEKGDKIQLSIEDNGLGIDLNKHGNQLFKLYETFHNHPDGKGVGLHLVKKLVTNLQGDISVVSEVNKGTKFTITFPKKQYND